MDDMAFIVSRMLETKIAMAENNGNNTLIVTLDVLKEILALLKDQEHKDKMLHALEEDWKRLKELLKEQDSLLGIQQTADGITFISTGTAQQGEERGIVLGKSLMHEWIFKELLHKGLLTDDIRSVFEQAKRI